MVPLDPTAPAPLDHDVKAEVMEHLAALKEGKPGER